MIYLLLTSLIWAFSFGLIKGGLSGLPSSAVAFSRLAIALLVFAPFLRTKKLNTPDVLKLLLTGAVQYGLMYVAYIHAFSFLKAYEVALFTVFTPIYVALIHDLFERKISPLPAVAALLAVVGGIIIEYDRLDSSGLFQGFLLMQAANLCFAFGQIFYRRIMANIPDEQSDLQVFGILYAGAAITAGIATIGTDWSAFVLTTKQITILIYLGMIASGLGFFLWNFGARRTGASRLAVFNNLKIPLGILVSVLFFGETAHWLRLLAGGMLMVAALFINARKTVK